MIEREAPWWVRDKPAQFRAFAEESRRTAPLYARIAEAAAEDAEVLALLDAAPAREQRTVLLLAAVHDLVLGRAAEANVGAAGSDGLDGLGDGDDDGRGGGGSDGLGDDDLGDLARFYPSVAGDDARDRLSTEDPWPAFRAVCMHRAAELGDRIATRTTQTNEVGRAAGLVPMLEHVRPVSGHAPLDLVEVGASAGLNLCLDRFRHTYSPPGSDPFPGEGFTVAQAVGPVASPLTLRCRNVGDQPLPLGDRVGPIGARVGLDQAPVDVADPAAVRWLEACIFADRVDRLERLRAAVAVARQAPPEVRAGDAVVDLARTVGELARTGGDGPLVIAHSWALTYVADTEGFAAELAAIAADREVWWLSMEPAGTIPGLQVASRKGRYAADLSANTVLAAVHLRGHRRRDQVLGRSHPHLDWIDWTA